MARTLSAMTPLGKAAPTFSAVDVISGRTVESDRLRGKLGMLVMFLCRHCPFVKHIEAEIAKFAHDYKDKGIGLVAVSSNDAEAFPDDDPYSLKAQATEQGFTFPYLYDYTQEVAHAFEAACTPEFFLYDRNMKLVYRGQFDDSRPGNGIPVTGQDLRAAMDALLAGQPVSQDQKPSLGCNIKWK